MLQIYHVLETSTNLVQMCDVMQQVRLGGGVSSEV